MKKIKPSVVWLTTNRTCNNKCKWCYTFNYNCNNLTMDNRKVEKYIDALAHENIKKIILIGGEPTINKNIIDIIKYIKKNNITVSMASNGRKFSDIDFTLDCHKAGLDFVNVSVKGINEDQYIKNTGCQGYNEMMLGYNNLKNVGIKTVLSYVITNDNKQEFIELKDMLIENNVDKMFFMLYKPSIDDIYETITIHELAKACKTIYEVFKKSSIKINIEMSIPLCLFEKKLVDEWIDKKVISTCCHISKGRGIIFDTDFNILPCNHFVDHPLNDIKINENKLIEFWNSSDCTEFRKIVGTFPSLKCQKCAMWNYCGGGCFLRWLKDNPDDYICGGGEY